MMSRDERKLFSVDVSRVTSVENFLVEAEDHKMAAEQAARSFNDINSLYAVATHVPFSRVESWGENGRKVDEFKGDGTKGFSFSSNVREIVAYTRLMNGWFMIIGAMGGFALGVMLSR
jgi:hypothetical protein